MPHLIETVTGIEALGDAFESLTESIEIETSSATGELVCHMFSALAEFESNLISERTREGLKASRKRGINGGRPPALEVKACAQIRVLTADRNASPTEIAKRYGVKRSTMYKVVGDVGGPDGLL